jgi:hypothetical protein
VAVNKEIGRMKAFADIATPVTFTSGISKSKGGITTGA